MSIPVGANAGWTAQPGVFGNLVGITLLLVDGAPDFAVAVSGTSILITVGTSGGETLTNITWAAMAALFNAAAAAAALCLMEGNANTTVPIGAPEFFFTLTGGSAVLGAGQFFAAAAAAPAPPAPPVVTLTFKGQKVYA